MREPHLLVVDVETDSLDASQAHILEIAIASVNLHTGRVDVPLGTLVRPDCDSDEWTSCWFMRQSGLSPDLFCFAPPFEVVRDQVQRLISGLPVTAYNAAFDVPILSRHGVVIGEQWPCLMLTCTAIMRLPSAGGNYKYPSFAEAWQYFFPGIRRVGAHRAGPDAMHEAQLAYELYLRGFLTQWGTINERSR